MACKLSGMAYSFFSVNEVKARGWLQNQLKIQATGLGGRLDQFWPDIMDSQWIGGNAEGWERVPYWLDGFIPLAFLLDDGGMKARAKRYIDEIISRQQQDGWICPVHDTDRSTYDMWALFLILKVLVVWHDATGDQRVEEVVHKALLSMDRHIDNYTLFGWAQTRWFEGLIAIYWLYDRTGGQWLLDLAVKLRAQGFDWVAFYEDWPMTQPLAKHRWSQMNHVVNQAMMLKSGPLYSRLSGLARDRQAACSMIAQLDRWHGTVTGMFTGDECLAGVSPVQGTELCAVVEAMYSLEWLLALTGDPRYGDRLERIAFNALPAAFSPDMQWHQYVQQVNQVECSRQEDPIFMTTSPESNLFGVEPHFGCCTANMHQGWPKFVLSAYMRSTKGLAIMSLAPAALDTRIKGVPVQVETNTAYPFRNSAKVTVAACTPVDFTLSIRIPAWAKDAKVSVDGRPVSAKAGEFVEIMQSWNKNIIDIELPMTATAGVRSGGLYAVTRGPLVYSLPIGEKWELQNKEDAENKPWLNNYEVLPTTTWNYGLALDPSRPQDSLVFEEHDIGRCPFSPDGAPVSMKAPARQVPWGVDRGAATPQPSGVAEGPVCEITLIPYGCTNLRMTEMPFVCKIM